MLASLRYLNTLKSQINILVGNFVKINKRTGGKIEPKYSLNIPILLVQVFEFLPKIEIIAQNDKRTGWNKNVLVGKILKN